MPFHEGIHARRVPLWRTRAFRRQPLARAVPPGSSARDPEGKVPIIVLTASGGPLEWKRLSAMGADRLLVKPVVLDDVIAVVRHTLKERAVTARQRLAS